MFACSTPTSTSSPVVAKRNMVSHSCVFVQIWKGKIEDYVSNNSSYLSVVLRQNHPCVLQRDINTYLETRGVSKWVIKDSKVHRSNKFLNFYQLFWIGLRFVRRLVASLKTSKTTLLRIGKLIVKLQDCQFFALFFYFVTVTHLWRY